MTDPIKPNAALRLLLTADVEAAVETLEANDTPSNRRNTIRTIFAGIEGLFWAMKSNVHWARNRQKNLTHHEIAAFEEKTHTVRDNGLLRERDSFVPLPSGLKFVARQTEKLHSGFKLDTEGQGWRCLIAAKSVRDNLVHPKSVPALDVTKKDVKNARKAFDWMLETYADVLHAIISMPKPESEPAKIKMPTNDLLVGDLATRFNDHMDKDWRVYFQPKGSDATQPKGLDATELFKSIENFGANLKAIKFVGPRLPNMDAKPFYSGPDDPKLVIEKTGESVPDKPKKP
jgi:hypothetical protein